MTPKHRTSEVRMIPIDRIDVLNPRDRNKRVFEEIVGNIKTIGLILFCQIPPHPIRSRHVIKCKPLFLMNLTRLQISMTASIFQMHSRTG